jgi:hypothetical protein
MHRARLPAKFSAAAAPCCASSPSLPLLSLPPLSHCSLCSASPSHRAASPDARPRLPRTRCPAAPRCARTSPTLLRRVDRAQAPRALPLAERDAEPARPTEPRAPCLPATTPARNATPTATTAQPRSQVPPSVRFSPLSSL